MKFAWTKLNHTPIAVDFGAHSVKLLQIAPGRDGAAPQLIAAASMPAPADLAADPAAQGAFYQDALNQLLKSHPFRGRKAVCATPASHTLVQHLQLPAGDEAELLSAVEEELRVRMNLEPARLVVRHFPVGTFTRDGAPRREVICIAISRDTVMRHIHIANRAGLDITGVFSEAQAVLAAFGHLYRRATDVQRVTCFIDLGAAAAKVIIAHGTQMVFAKSIRGVGLGGDDSESSAAVTRDHAPPGTLPLMASHATAAAGLAVLDRPAAAPTATGPADEALACLADELRLCLRYHQSMFPEQPVEKMVFLGGGARHVRRCESIARLLRIGAQLGDPLARLTRGDANAARGNLDMREPQPGWAVPMGLCLSAE